MRKQTILLIGFLLLTGCAGSGIKLKDWQHLPKEEYTIPPFAKELAKYKIALDPGHGGMAHLPGYKRGPSGSREAVMNLRVAEYLKAFLQRAGAEVFLTREDDRFVSLRERVEKAEAAGCDFLISLHHNFSRNPQSNFAAVFYHLTPDYQPFSIDLARNIYFGLVEALRLPQVIEDGLLTDQMIYPAGFGLLRHAKIPAILLESSFYSNRKEEKRLMNKKYNRREAYGIFLGLARWAAGGVPKVTRVAPKGISKSKRPDIRYRISDGISDRSDRNLPAQRIFSSSVAARIDSRFVPVHLSLDKTQVSFRPDSLLRNGEHLVQVFVENMFKNHNLPHVDTLIVASPVDSILLASGSPVVPADSLALLPLKLTFLDRDAEPAWDGTRLVVQASSGRILPESPTLHDGTAIVYLGAVRDTGTVHLSVAADSVIRKFELQAVAPGTVRTLSGVVLDDSTHAPIPDVGILLDDSLAATSDRNGVFWALNPPPGQTKITVLKDGFVPKSAIFLLDSLRSRQINLTLKAVLGGILHGQTIILDAATDFKNPVVVDSLTLSDANLLLTRNLAAALTRAGANAVLVRDSDTRLSAHRRIQMVNKVPEGWYLKIGYKIVTDSFKTVQTTIYPANETGEAIATAINQAYAAAPHTRTVLLQDAHVPEVRLTNKTAVDLQIRCPAPRVSEDLQHILQGIVAFRRAEIQKENEQPDSE